jgi:hypothetical protein
MEKNKYNVFYSKKLASDLLQQLLMYKITGSGIDEKWHEALILHLNERNLNQEERSLYVRILETPPEILKKDEQLFSNKIKEKERFEIDSSVTTKKHSEINKAGKSLKRVTLFGFCLIISSIVGIFISLSSNNLNTIKYLYQFLGGASILCYLLILNSLYEAGESLEKYESD